MTDKVYTKEEIASKQLETAIILFLSGRDLSSVITLAGAAGNILEQLVRFRGEEPFLDFACRVYDALEGYTPPRKKYKHHIEKKLGVSTHKHMNGDDSKFVNINLEKSAIDSITKAFTDYIVIHGQNNPFVTAFFNWCWKNMDGEKIMEDYKNIPSKLKKNA
jgi:hypothetical protein